MRLRTTSSAIATGSMAASSRADCAPWASGTSLVAHQRYDTLPTAPLDIVMRPPCPPGIDVTDFDRHTEIFSASYLWARQAIVELEAEGNAAIAAILAAGKPPTKRPRHLAELAGNALSS